MKHILIALDYDPTAKKVAETGAALAKAMKADITLLHVYADASYYSTLDYSPIMGFKGFSALSLEDTTKDLVKHSQHFLDRSKEHLGGGAIRTIVAEGDTADTIVRTAKDINADIIVMGSHSHRWLDTILMGSITEEVLHHTLIPLFIVPTAKK